MGLFDKTADELQQQLAGIQEYVIANQHGTADNKKLVAQEVLPEVAEIQAAYDQLKKKLEKEIDKANPNPKVVAKLAGQCADLQVAIAVTNDTIAKGRELSIKEKKDIPLSQLQSIGTAHPTNPALDAVMRTQMERKCFGESLMESSDRLQKMAGALKQDCQVDPTKPVVRDLNQENALREYANLKVETGLNNLERMPGYQAAQGEAYLTTKLAETTVALNAAKKESATLLAAYQQSKSAPDLKAYKEKSAEVRMLQAEESACNTHLKNERGAQMAADIGQRVDINALMDPNTYSTRESLFASLKTQLNTPDERYNVEWIQAAENNALFIVTDTTNPDAKIALKVSSVNSNLTSQNADYTQSRERLAGVPQAGQIYSLTAVPGVATNGDTGVVEMSEYMGGKNMQARHHAYATTHYKDQEPSELALLNHQLKILNDTQVVIDIQKGYKQQGLAVPDLKPSNIIADTDGSDKVSDQKSASPSGTTNEYELTTTKRQHHPFPCTYDRPGLTMREEGGVRTYNFAKQDEVNVGMSMLSLISENGGEKDVLPYCDRQKDTVVLYGQVISTADGQTPTGSFDAIADKNPHFQTETGKQLYEISSGLINGTMSVANAEVEMANLRGLVEASIDVTAKKAPVPYQAEIEQARTAVNDVAKSVTGSENLKTMIAADPVLAGKVADYKGNVEDLGNGVARAVSATSEYQTAASKVQLTEYARAYDAVKATPAIVDKFLGDTLVARGTAFIDQNATIQPAKGQANPSVLDAGLQTPRTEATTGAESLQTLGAKMNSARQDEPVPGLHVQPNAVAAGNAASIADAFKSKRAAMQNDVQPAAEAVVENEVANRGPG